MIDETLIKSNFIGRDSFRWWIGQIAPIEAHKSQVEGEGWASRHKVRILGYHPFSKESLPDEDLTWASVLLPPTGGSGGAGGSATSLIMGHNNSQIYHAGGIITSASFHNIEATSLSGDGSQFTASLQTQLLTSVIQISNSISGSFTSGFDIESNVSSSFGLAGDAWSVGGAVIDRSRALSGFGTTDAAIKAAGVNVNDSIASNEEWNGAIWSEIADLPANRKRGATAGSVNAGLYAGGNDGGFSGYSECSEVYIWTGITWVETLDLPVGGDNHTGH